MPHFMRNDVSQCMSDLQLIGDCKGLDAIVKRVDQPARGSGANPST